MSSIQYLNFLFESQKGFHIYVCVWVCLFWGQKGMRKDRNWHSLFEAENWEQVLHVSATFLTGDLNQEK